MDDRFHSSIACMLSAGVIACGLSMQAQTKSSATRRAISEPAHLARSASLQPIPSPDLSGMDAPVQQQIRDAQSRVATVTSNRNELSQAYGWLGEIYQAYSLNDAAVACYINARTIEPREFRWSYYLGYLFQTEGDLQRALSNYKTALQLRPGDELTLLRLASVDLGLNRLEEAERLYAQEMGRNKQSIGALDGLGRVALARRDFAGAISYFNKALAIDPQAAFIHYPLAMAYRGLGELEKARTELAKHGPAAPELTDRYLTELRDIKTGKADLWVKGSQQMAESNFPEAIATYRKLVERDEGDAVARTYLGTALARAGNAQEAIQQFTEALRVAPENTETHYCLGVVLAALGKDEEAIGHFRATIKGDPQFDEAHFQLANVLMRTHHYEEAAAEYEKTVNQNPDKAFAFTMEAMALVRLDRYKDARSVLERAHSAAPSNMDIDNALARLLAASPDNAVRDGQRALELMQQVVKSQGSVDSDQAETIAMALAETGQFEKAAGILRSVIETEEHDNFPRRVEALRRTLVLYEHGQACRIPWPDDDPIFSPSPQKSAGPPQALLRFPGVTREFAQPGSSLVLEATRLSIHDAWRAN
jgi:tetratricopeptide (TPR) repeat protein